MSEIASSRLLTRELTVKAQATVPSRRYCSQYWLQYRQELNLAQTLTLLLTLIPNPIPNPNLNPNPKVTPNLSVSLTLGLPDIPYFTGAPVFEPLSPASREEATREMKSPVFQLRPVSH